MTFNVYIRPYDNISLKGGAKLTLLATGPAISPTAPETKNEEAGVKHYGMQI